MEKTKTVTHKENGSNISHDTHMTTTTSNTNIAYISKPHPKISYTRDIM